jgi:hypothetical protein
MSKKQGCMAGVMLGSLIKFFLTGFWMLIKVIASLIWFFGLWLPAAYALFGLILYWVFGFNPLKLELEGQLYISGFIACCLCSIVISIRNLIVKPAKSILYGYKKPVWKKSGRKQAPDAAKPQTDELNSFQVRPSIYYSTLEENTLIHEYPDRFEIYRIADNKARLERVEYKNEED